MISRGYVDHCFMLCSHGPSKSNANFKESVKSQLFSMFSYLSPQTLTVCYLTFSLVPNFELHLRFVPIQSHRVGKIWMKRRSFRGHVGVSNNKRKQ